MWNRLKIVLAILAVCTGISILFLEAVLLYAGAWKERVASFRKPLDLFSESCDVTQFEEMDVVSSAVDVLYGIYYSTYNYYTSDDVCYYVLPIDIANQMYYMGIRETKGREEQFRKLAVRTEFDAKPKQGLIGNPLQEEMPEASGQVNEGEETIFIEGFLYRMDEYQYKKFLSWLEKTGYLEGREKDRIIPYFIAECDIAGYKKQCINAMFWIAVSVLMIIGSAAVLICRRNKHNSQTYVTIDGIIYAKERMAGVNQLVQNIELMQAIQELSRITGQDMLQSEKVIRNWNDYWF